MPASPLLRQVLLAGLFSTCLASPALAQTMRISAKVDGQVTSVSADGRAATGLAIDNALEVFRWTQRGGRVLLGRNPFAALGQGSGIPRISADGKVIVASILDDGGTYVTAGRWTLDGGWKTLAPPLPPAGGQLDREDSSAFGLSADGSIVTGLYWRPGATDGLAHGMFWSAASNMLDMGSGGRSSRIDGASADGKVLVGWDEHPTFGNRRAAVWVNGVRTVLEDSDWPSEVSAVNSSGTVLVGQSADLSDFQTKATMWTWNGRGWTKTLLGVISPSGTGFAFATGLSDDGSVVVGGYRPDLFSPQTFGFVWTAAGGFVDATEYFKSHGVRLNPLWPLIQVNAVSADGSTFAAVTAQRIAPFAVRTLLIRK